MGGEDVRQMIATMRGVWQFGPKRVPAIYHHCV